MPFKSFEATVPKEFPQVTVRDRTIAFNKAFIAAAIDSESEPNRCEVLIDEQNKRLAFRFGEVGYCLHRDGPKSSGRALQCPRLFKAISWLRRGKYKTQYSASDRAWLVRLK